MTNVTIARGFAFLSTALVSLAASMPASAQKIVEGATPSATSEKDDKALEALLKGSVDREIATSDGVYLSARYWTPKEAGKNTPAIILVHNRGRTQRDWFPIARQLADAGFAVVTFDLRGHGDSIDTNPSLYKPPKEALREEESRRARSRMRVVPIPKPRDSADRRTAKSRGQRIDHTEAFKSGKDAAIFFAKDLEAIKLFLVEENNVGRLNIRRTGLAATGFSGAVAMKWLEENEFASGSRAGWSRVGGDVAAIALISPPWTYKGFKMPVALANRKLDVPILLISSDQGLDFDSATRLARAFRIEPKELEVNKDVAKERTNPFGKGAASAWITRESKLTGTELVRAAELRIGALLEDFFTATLLGKKGFPWERRTVEGQEESFGTTRTQ